MLNKIKVRTVSFLLITSAFVSLLPANIFASENVKDQIKINKILMNVKHNQPKFVSGKLTLPSRDKAENIVKSYLVKKSGGKDFIVKREFKNGQKQTIVKTQQTYKGIKVKGTQQSYIIGEDGAINAVSGINIPDIESKIRGNIELTENSVLDIVKNDLKKDLKKANSLSIEKIIVPFEDNAQYAYLVGISFETPVVESWAYLINASNGKIIEKKDALIHQSVPVDGKGVLGDTKTMTGYNGTIPDLNITPDAPYSLADVTKTAPTGAVPRPLKILTYELMSTNSMNLNGNKRITSDNDGHFTEDSTKYNAVDSQFYISKVYDFYKEKFGRYSFDNQGSDIIGNVHAIFYNGDKNNACWDTVNKQMYYGDGDGTEFLGFAGEADTTGHEFTHGVIDTEAPELEYFGQLGAVNEGLADLFGEAFEAYTTGSNPDWLKMAQCYTPTIPGDAYIDMKNPNAKLIEGTQRSYPDHMENIYNGALDNYGVHINAAILTKAFSLMSDGGTFHNVIVPAIGVDKVSRIMYKVINEYLTNDVNFYDLSEMALDAATALYGEGSTEYKSIKAGFQAVGILNGVTQWKLLGESGMRTSSETTAICQADSNVYAVGGWNTDRDILLSDNWEYSILDNKWTKKKSMDMPRAFASSASVNGKVYMLYGFSDWDKYYTTIDQYDPATDQWSIAAYLPKKSVVDSSTYAAGTILYKPITQRDTWLELKTGLIAAGGSINVKIQGSNDNINFTDIKSFGTFNLSSSSTQLIWSDASNKKQFYRVVATVVGATCNFEISAPYIRDQSSVVSYGSKIYVLGGSDFGYDKILTMDIFDVNTNQWITDREGLLYGRNLPTLVTATVNNSPKIYVFAGANNNIEVYDINSGTWNHSAGTIPSNISLSGSSAAFYKGKIHFSSEGNGNGSAIGATVIYDPLTNVWSEDANVGVPNSDSSVSAVYGDHLYHISPYTFNALVRAEKYEPVRINAFENNNNILVQWSKFNNCSSTLSVDGTNLYTGTSGNYSYTSFANTSKKHQIKITQSHPIYGSITSKNLCTVYQKIGDVDGNNVINSSDVTLIQNSILGIVTLTNLQKVAADINNDNEVTSIDLAILQRFVNNNTPYERIGKIEFMIYGDVNNDGDIDMDDYAIVIESILTGSPLTFIQAVKGDVNGNGVIESTDLSYIRRYYLLENITFPAVN